MQFERFTDSGDEVEVFSDSTRRTGEDVDAVESDALPQSPEASQDELVRHTEEYVPFGAAIEPAVLEEDDDTGGEVRIVQLSVHPEQPKDSTFVKADQQSQPMAANEQPSNLRPVPSPPTDTEDTTTETEIASPASAPMAVRKSDKKNGDGESPQGDTSEDAEVSAEPAVGGDGNGNKPPNAQEAGGIDDDGDDDSRDDNGPYDRQSLGREDRARPTQEPIEQRTALTVNEVRSPSDASGESLQRRETLRATLAQLGGDRLVSEMVVVGSEALDAALPGVLAKARPESPEPRDTDVVGSPEVVAYLRTQRSDLGWREVHLPGAATFLKSGDIEIGTHWSDERMSYGDLDHQAWTGADGVKRASLPHLTAWMDLTGREKDERTMDEVRDRLRDPEAPPLDPRVVASEQEVLGKVLERHIGDHMGDEEVQKALRLAAEGKIITGALQGGVRGIKINLPIVGDFEPKENGARGHYHNASGLKADSAALAVFMDRVNAEELAEGRQQDELTFQPVDYAIGTAAVNLADGAYGFGRESNQREGSKDQHDEGRSAVLALKRAEAIGLPPEKAQRLYRVIGDTAFREDGSGYQRGKYSDDLMSQGLCGVDLAYALSSYEGIGYSWDLAAEDPASNRYDEDRVVGRLIQEQGVVLRRPNEVFAFVDANADARPSSLPPNRPRDKPVLTAREAVVERLEGCGKFTDPLKGYQFPPVWSRLMEDKAIRQEVADKTLAVVAELRASPGYSLVDAQRHSGAWGIRRTLSEAGKRGEYLNLFDLFE